ncbi:hypothetical protein PR003_g10102 [Phytophthora rubi]|uniref:Uncharacterized protein n=1 Tax=Phytophthora rubi TaxID=129364 RepID=A0A6A3M352_9STRA|nr:hypothetical protein PR002_g11333 [Phytophthora rubi]KAE9035897.1 hypothetical protein PR001_g9100 [Phytophthora rubi]KAE9341205.1 hypothetical protein PR003_g10102 [Phytophthora rubi]
MASIYCACFAAAASARDFSSLLSIAIPSSSPNAQTVRLYRTDSTSIPDWTARSLHAITL